MTLSLVSFALVIRCKFFIRGAAVYKRRASRVIVNRDRHSSSDVPENSRRAKPMSFGTDRMSRTDDEGALAPGVPFVHTPGWRATGVSGFRLL